MIVTITTLILSGFSKDFILINNSDEKFISSDHFKSCILKSNYSDLVPKVKYANEEIKLEYLPAAKTENPCEGIYYYILVSRSFRQPLYRDSNGQKHSRYYLFILLDDKIHSTLKMTEIVRMKYYETNKSKLILRFGEESISDLEEYILRGYRDFY